MGNKLATQTATADYYLHELDGIVFERSIGNGRLLKALKCLNAGASVVVKVYVKRPPYTDLSAYQEHLTGLFAIALTTAQSALTRLLVGSLNHVLLSYRCVRLWYLGC
jgi:hypothetical protein